MKTRPSLILCLIFGIAAGGTSSAHAASRSFTGSVSSDWATAGNWEPEGAPGASDDVTIPAGTDAELTTAATVLTLQLAGTLGGSGDLTIGDMLLWNSGAMIGAGATRVVRSATIGGSSDKSLGRTLEIDDSGNWSGGDLILSDTATLRVGMAAILHLTGDGSVRSAGGTPRVENSGMIIKVTGTGTTSFIGVDLSNKGSVVVETGTLRLNGNGEHAGSFQAAGGAIEFSGGTHTLAVTSRIAGAAVTFNGADVDAAGAYEVEGSTTVAAGTLALRGHVGKLASLRILGGILDTRASNVVIFVDTLAQSDGLLTGNSILVATGPTTWSGGEMSGFGITNANGDLLLDGSGTRTLTRLLTSNASGAWASSGFLIIGEGGLLQNRPDGRFEVRTAFGVFTGGGLPRIENTGTFIHGSSSESRLNGVAFINKGDGEVDVAAGLLRFDGGYRQDSGRTRLSGGTIASNRELMLNGGHLEGSGTINADVMNAGEITLGAAAALQIGGAYTQTASGNLDVTLGGTTPGSFGRMTVDSARLDGTLTIHQLEAYQPKLGDSATILDFAIANGDFSQVMTPVLMNGLAYRVATRSKEIVVQVVVCEPGSCQPTTTPDLDPSPTPSPSPTPTPTPTPIATRCDADCDRNGMVSLSDVLQLIEIALAQSPLAACMSGDLNNDGAVTIEEIIDAVAVTDAGC